ncbi:hypothetical protein PYV02_06740 [Leifsonia sp. H3M29-4]|uniref:hypothetical protein n=1 Tax=Salinibacterium metalliresistens TaxID=3031321 RepID=UPI0023DC9E06|nr:hypothetical protein [Salinibacterium metalliresistens]MDF1478780.1 hypothetical protein [Salinibacterium metalliresistens]
MTTQPTPIPHLIDAANALSLALRELNTLSPGVRQDGLEHLSEVELLTELLNRQLAHKQ